MTTETTAKALSKRAVKKSKREAMVSEPPSVDADLTAKPLKLKRKKDSPKTDAKSGEKGEAKKLEGKNRATVRTGGDGVGDSSPAKAEGKGKKSGNPENESEEAKKVTVEQETVVRGEKCSKKRKADEAQMSVAEEAVEERKVTGRKAKKEAVADDHNTKMISGKNPKQVEDSGKKSKKAKIVPQPPSPALESEAVATSEKLKKSPLKLPDGGKKAKKSKLTPKVPSPSPGPVPSLSENEEQHVHIEEPSDDEEDVHLHGFSTDDDDSSDEDDAMGDELSAFDVSKLPTIAKDDATVKRKLEKAKRQPTEDRGVLYLGRIPHGFYEDQLKSYFSQFGSVTRLRLSRSKKTGQSKHYGFLEFDSSSVAQIVADTMDNYLLMGHILRCKVIPRDEVHPELWVGANRKWRAVPKDRLTRVEHNKPRTEEEQARAAKRLIKRQNDRKRKLEEAGIKYDFEAVGYKTSKAGKT